MPIEIQPFRPEFRKPPILPITNRLVKVKYSIWWVFSGSWSECAGSIRLAAIDDELGNRPCGDEHEYNM